MIVSNLIYHYLDKKKYIYTLYMDNKYFSNNCPSRMSDGRHFTTYVRSQKLDETYQKNNKLNLNEHQYRMFLQKNTDNVIDNFFNESRIKYMCNVN